jgi:conjugative relaxase-like TrwC/TraI family protein
MMGVGKVGGGGAGYYLEAVADGVDEYYRGIGEAPGRWIGHAAPSLGLEGDVDAGQLRSLWAGEHPETGERLGPLRGREVCGFDLSLMAPKSVSLLFAFGTEEITTAVRDAHDAAVDAAFGYMQDHAFVSRTGKGGTGQIAVKGVTAAKFRHRTSRAGDPHLHTHVLVANAAEGIDGAWRTVDGRLIYAHAKTGGFLYQAHLRHELTARLGVEWGPVVHGCADIAGIDPEVISGFSERRTEILEHLDEVGFRSARARQLATLDTRHAKTEVDEVTMRTVWDAKAADLGLDPDELIGLCGERTVTGISDTAIDGLFARLAGPEGLTARASTFDRRDLLQGIAAGLPAGATVAEIEALADRFVLLPEIQALDTTPGLLTSTVIRRGDGRIIAAPVATRRWSTRELVAMERRLIDTALDRATEGAGIVDHEVIARTLAVRPTLSDEQRQMITTLLGRGAGVEVVAAAAGTGKTFSLDAARAGWQAAGYRVIGAALSGRAAAELEASAAIESSTLALLAINLHTGRQHLDALTVLVIDEASLAGTRTLAPILDRAATTGAKVVLTGDPRQLPEIDAGGVLVGLAARTEPIRLVQNRRQCEAWERDALNQLRDGDVDRAFAAYQRHGRVVTAATASEVRTVMVAEWWAYRVAGDQVAMLAPNRSDVDDLNGRARAYRQRAGHLSGPTLHMNDRPFQAGDDIVCLRNDYKLGVRNGTRATITRVDADAGTITITIETGKKSVILPAAYLHEGHLAHGYATTIHKAQGATVDRALLLGTDDLCRESGYVGLSRGKLSNHLYLVGARTPDLAAAHGPEPERPDPIDVIRHALHQRRPKHLAIDTGTPVPTPTPPEPIAPEPRRPFPVRPAPANPVPVPPDTGYPVPAQPRRARPRPVTPAPAPARPGRGPVARPPRPEPSLRDLMAERRHLAEVLRQCPPDRHTDHQSVTKRRIELATELGPVRDRHDDLADTRFKRRAGRAELRTLEDRIDRLETAIARLDTELDAIEDHIAAHDEFRARHQPNYQRQTTVETAIQQTLDHRIELVAARPTRYLLDTLGVPPNEPDRLTIWKRGARAIETHRAEHGIDEPYAAFGHRRDGTPEPVPVELRRQLQQIERALNPPARDLTDDFGLSL